MKILVIEYDVTDLSEGEIDCLTGQALAQGERSDYDGGDGHPDVKVTSKIVERVGMRSHTSEATVIEFTPGGAPGRPLPRKRLGYVIDARSRDLSYVVEPDDEPDARRLLGATVTITYYPDDQFAKLVRS